MKQRRPLQSTAGLNLALWATVALVALGLDRLAPMGLVLPSGMSVLQLLSLVAGMLVTANLFTLATWWSLRRRNKPQAEALMVGRLWQLAGVFAILLGVGYGLGQLASFSSFFTLFGGMLLGWSLQAPVSGFAAWVLISLMRPFRPGDRIQFPSLGLVGDVDDVGAMYTVLDQVGGTIGSEEAVGRYILVPNAMLFSQVVINYTVQQEAPYMLDEVVVRITYDSDWEAAELILLDAAQALTKDIIDATGVQPYIRSDLYDYGVYLRLRYQTRVQDRPEIAYRLTKRIFEATQRTPSIDLAIPYVYSYRAGADRKDSDSPRDREGQVAREGMASRVEQVEVDLIQGSDWQPDAKAVEELAQSIAANGLLQPVVVSLDKQSGMYALLAGHLRLEACRKLGWSTVPALVRTDAPGREAQRIQDIEIANIAESDLRPDPQTVEQLAQSISSHGLLQPIVVMKDALGDSYSVLAGQGRLEACRRLGWTKIPAVVRASPN